MFGIVIVFVVDAAALVIDLFIGHARFHLSRIIAVLM